MEVLHVLAKRLLEFLSIAMAIMLLLKEFFHYITHIILCT